MELPSKEITTMLGEGTPLALLDALVVRRFCITENGPLVA